ncbi:hypothetical protein [Winogradskyella algicola]|uniref:hypothetical protein n=1 Tax=Winogradskyella algicola TaxID=2575815 RepID=UPI001108E43F|nr:hypothetical protein [Winogradskyella algicola]
MDSNLVSAIIGAGATLFAGIITTFGKEINSHRKIKQLGYPDIKGHWKASWFIDNIKEVYLEDTVVINKIKGINIYGEGINHVNGNYPISGKFSKNLILNFIYESSKNYISLSGVIILKINPLGTECKGRWYGYTKEDELTGGDVLWKKI